MVIEIDDNNYSEFIESIDKVVFIDFYSPSCGPCLELLPLLDRLDKYYEDKGAVIAKVNVAQNPKLAQKYKIAGVPFCVVVGRDKMVKEVEMGMAHPDMYYALIDKALGSHKSFFQKVVDKFKS